MIKVSIIIPFKNVEEYIEKCITGVLNQTLTEIEVICVNDGSSDKSLEIVQNFAQEDDRVIVLETDKSLGQSYARNIALDVAKGEYIGFVDSDDFVEREMFEKMYNRAKSGDTDITMCLAKLYDDGTEEDYSNDYYGLKSYEKYGDKIFNAGEDKDNILNLNVVIWNKIYKRTFLKTNKLRFENGYIYEDLPFSYGAYLSAEKINIIWEYFYHYRQNRKHSTMQNKDKKIYDRIDMVELTYGILKKSEYFKEKQTDILCWVIDDIFHRYTLLEPEYYEEYYKRMRNMFIALGVTEEQKSKLDVSYCYDEFCNILERNYFGFWNFLIEKYKTTNKVIKTIKHEHNESMNAIKAYMEEYKAEKEKEREELENWWKNHCEEIEEKSKNELNKAYAELGNERKRAENEKYELNRWHGEELRNVEEKITAEYQWKIEQQNRHYKNALNKQKNYYENNFLSVKIVLNMCRFLQQFKNSIKKMLKKN